MQPSSSGGHHSSEDSQLSTFIFSADFLCRLIYKVKELQWFISWYGCEHSLAINIMSRVEHKTRGSGPGPTFGVQPRRKRQYTRCTWEKKTHMENTVPPEVIGLLTWHGVTVSIKKKACTIYPHCKASSTHCKFQLHRCSTWGLRKS